MRQRKTINAILTEQALTKNGITKGDSLILNKDLLGLLGISIPLVSLGIIMANLGFTATCTPNGTYYFVNTGE